MTRHPQVAAAAAAVTILALAACSPPADAPASPEPPTQVDFSPVYVPPAMRPESLRVWDLSAVAPTPTAPLLIAGVKAEPGGPPEPAFWTYDGGAPESVVIDLGADGAAQSVAVAASPDVTAVAGHMWSGGTVQSFLATSTDRATWQTVPLPKGDEVRLAKVTVVGPTAYSVGEGSGESLLGYATAAGEVVPFSLPDVPAGHERALVGLAGHDSELVVIADEGAAVEATRPVAYRSRDLGRTWTGPVPIQEYGAIGVSGVVWTGSTYVATGSADPEGTSIPPAWRPAAWSGDGSAWTAETVPEHAEGAEESGRATGLEAPSTVDGVTAAAMWSHDDRSVYGYLRTPEGVWSVDGHSEKQAAFPVGGAAALGQDGVLYVVAEADGAAALYRAGGTEEWTSSGRLADWNGWRAADRAYEMSEGLRIQASEWYLTEGDGKVRTGRAGAVFTLGTSGLEPAGWEAEGQIGGPGTVAAVGPGGAEIVTSGSWDNDRTSYTVTGSFRSAAGAPWQPTTGLPGDGSAIIRSIAWTGQDWVATGYAWPSLTGGYFSDVAIWTSVDGVAWARVTEGLTNADQGLDVTGVCVLPDGSPLVLGGEGGTSIFKARATGWLRSGGAWSQVSLPDVGDGGLFTSCEPSEGGLLLRRASDGPDALWRTTDGTTFEHVFAVEPGDTMLELESVPGGFAAFGSIDTADYVGPVLWLSRDGVAWRSVPVPTRTTTTSAVMHATGADLLVIASTPSGEEAFIVHDIEEVLTQVTAKDD